MAGSKKQVIHSLALRWCINPNFLEDVYFLLLNDPRFLSTREPYGVRYIEMSRHLDRVYHVEVNERQLKYLVKIVKRLAKY